MLRKLTSILAAPVVLLSVATVYAATLTAEELNQIKLIKAALPPAKPAPDPAAVSSRLFPDGEGRELAIRTCVVCHEAELVASNRRGVEEWDRIIAKMVAYGAKADDDQQLALLQYFAIYLAPTPPPR